MSSDRKHHWNKVYTKKSPLEVSWYQPRPALSLELIESCGLDRDTAIIDVGAGTSTLVDELLQLGHSNLAVLDVSEAAIGHGKTRLGAQAEKVEWYVGDVTEFEAPHQFGLWHDRAVLHFLTDSDDRANYRRSMLGTVENGGHAVVATFSLEGPPRCSGLDVVRYSPETLSAELGPELELVTARDEAHETPTGATQAFTYCLFHRI
jgi:2-polyprenyl-3-methyl-5-hydroxy-6-metoxy-1,4-benzoquinol methylase